MMQGMQCLYISFLVPIGIKVTMHWMTRKDQSVLLLLHTAKEVTSYSWR